MYFISPLAAENNDSVMELGVYSNSIYIFLNVIQLKTRDEQSKGATTYDSV